MFSFMKHKLKKYIQYAIINTSYYFYWSDMK